MKKIILYIIKLMLIILYTITFPFYLLVSISLKWEERHFFTVLISSIMPVLLIWCFLTDKNNTINVSTTIIALFFYSLMYSMIVVAVYYLEHYITFLIIAVFGFIYRLNLTCKEKIYSLSINLVSVERTNRYKKNRDKKHVKFIRFCSIFKSKKKTDYKNNGSNTNDSYRFNQNENYSGNQQTGASKSASRYHDALTLFMLDEPFTLSELKTRRKVLIKTFHPDNSVSTNTEAEKINNAFDILKQYASK